MIADQGITYLPVRPVGLASNQQSSSNLAFHLKILRNCVLVMLLCLASASVLAEEERTYLDCGNEGEEACALADRLQGAKACDRGLVRNLNNECVNGTGLFARRHADVSVFLSERLNQWLVWARNNQRDELAIDEPLNWVMHLAAHNAHNNRADGYAAPNQKYSVTDMLRLGVRTILIDLNFLGDWVRLVHGDGVTTDRLFFNLVKELANWLALNPDQVVIVQIQNDMPGDVDNEKVNDPITRFLGGEGRDVAYRLAANTLTNDVKRWPTRREMVEAGKQIIFVTERAGTTEGNVWISYAAMPFGGLNTLPDARWIIENCHDAGWDHHIYYGYDPLLQFGGNRRTDLDGNLSSSPYLMDRIEERPCVLCTEPGSGDGPGWFLPGEVYDLANCNKPVVSMNDITPESLNEGIWSWRSWPQGWIGDVAYMQLMDGRWYSDLSADSEMHFACAPARTGEPLEFPHTQDLVTDDNRSGGDWKVTYTVGPWHEGDEHCKALGEKLGMDLTFNVPVNGWQNQYLLYALIVASADPDFDRSSLNTWLAYRTDEPGSPVTPPGSWARWIDSDGDGVEDENDVCPGHDDLQDSDGDGTPDGCDTCPSGDDALDADGDGVPDDCDICFIGDDTLDLDGDFVPDACDICPGFDDFLNADGDATPDGCDICPLDALNDQEGDGWCESEDNCPLLSNPDQADLDHDGIGDVCDPDIDNDGVANGDDNCALVANPGQEDWDADGVGDLCDDDVDGDGIANPTDQCAMTVPGVVVNGEGCSIDDLNPCEQTFEGETWKNHGAYMKSLVHAAKMFVEAGLISRQERDDFIMQAAQSSCGR